MNPGVSDDMKPAFLALPLLFCLALVAGFASAQDSLQPVFAYRSGDIWKYDPSAGAATQLTHWGYNGGPILSPDGAKIAYLSTSADFVSKHKSGTATQTGGTAPANLWVMDVATENFRLIADQSGASATGVLRSLPTWSPDSRKLVWLELDPGLQALDAAKLIVHSLESGLSSTLASNVDLGFQGSNIRMPSLRWGGGGIARLHFDYPGGGANAFLYIQFYDASSGALSQFDLGLNEDRDNTVRDFVWVEHLGRSLMALQIKNYWDLIDPETGARSRLLDPPRLQNRNFSGGTQLIPHSVETSSGDWRMRWHAKADAATHDTGYSSSRVNRNNRPALSPDGAQMAFADAQGVNSWQVGGGGGSRRLIEAASSWEFPIPQPFGLVWAPMKWVTTGALDRAQAAPALPPVSSNCALPPLLIAGQQAIVSPGLGNRVRAAASLEAELVGAIQPGDVVSIEAGPVCADGYHWYFARGDRLAGWTAEGGAGEYWLYYHIDCFNSPPIRLSATMRATVAGSRSLEVRNGKGREGTDVITLVSSNDAFWITGRPECDWRGLRWYPIQYRHFLGWIAAGSVDEYYIEAAN